MTQVQNDQELLALFREPATKEQAFTGIIKKYQEKLYWHIRRMVISHDDADDVLQNMFIKVWKGLDNFREDSQLYTWLYRIATNESLTFLAKAKKRNSISISDDENGLSNKLKATIILMPINWNGNCSWRYNRFPKNNALYLI